MTKAQQAYEQWLQQPHLPEDLRAELERIRGKDDEIEDRFGADLDFGTGGLRGVMGAGLNRMNVYTVRRATAALALHLQARGEDAVRRGVAIGYDVRHNSPVFAETVALTLAAFGIRAYLSPVVCPTPELSFAVRDLGCAAGVMITASHNPPKYNGYKVYNEHGGQILEDDARDIKARMETIQDVFAIDHLTREEAEKRGLLTAIPASLRAKYIETVVREVRDPRIRDERSGLSIVYTPLHGTGNIPVREALRAAGYTNVHLVQEQVEPDGDFSTVKSPNPEEQEALSLGVKLAEDLGAHLVMGNDPDCDRVGIAVRDGSGRLQLLTGNQVGALIVHYLCERHRDLGGQGLPPIVFKTIVTSDMGKHIAESYGVHVEETLTGFKYIGDRITRHEADGTYRLLAGYEESYGYLVSPIVRDKDGVQGALVIAEMAAWHLAHGRTLVDVLRSLYETYGWFGDKLVNVELEGHDGVDRMKRALNDLRQRPLEVPGLELVAVEDYLARERRFPASGRTEPLTLPVSDVQKFIFEGGHWAAIRPSGTEPKMKMYFGVRGRSEAERDELLDKLVRALSARARME
ncbi:alpha-phosphoglucomutase [Alicyclobacillus vulcanalis]|uniref:phosphoglucomutase (alpha-D-glucose-1,6-bisphosphate-dependent) n=1 Tax=Alicyclobacillus vulcanalis TaxID=252246 RepID=A0A1N7JMW8_9BACL|nr:alpha-phosphoglucomutase [Alicyclobacillus vulcanalis]